MLQNTVTTADVLKQKIQDNRFDLFTLPILEVTIKYRKPDLLKLSLNNSLPTAMADSVVEAYKEALGGTDYEEYQRTAAEREIKPNKELVEDVSKKGYNLLEKLCVSHKILDVPESDPDNDLIAWDDIPEEDAISFLINVLNKAQTARTKDGGEMSAEDITTFPGKRRSNKRSIPGEGG